MDKVDKVVRSNLAKVSSTRRLLILSCSQRKHEGKEPLQAILRYDGPPFRVLRKFLRKKPEEANLLDVFILSARFGLIESTFLIPDYDQLMTDDTAIVMRPQVLESLGRILQREPYTEMFLGMSKSYLIALAGYRSQLPRDLRVTVAGGTQGRKLSLLRDWLYGGPLVQAKTGPTRTRGTVTIRGIEIKLTRAAVFATAREALRTDGEAAMRYQSWYVEIDDHRVAPKWLVSKLTGLPVSDFVTSEACRVLSQLGVEVKRK